ncbi:glycoside hydrolase family 88 protein [Enterococcus lemanii]|uniref:Glycoside hydrolase family 88 protein n=1 Tax=Enterococcus lemanii TaxID=1159752 RepID=A0ABV9MYI8_9ENTE|nr:glycoside hydrolase family 88 protein [Enterococcus lemanii]MBM7708209.1 unsaturated chondroitin disaccharide hydrolase [Enterococcus lemanii]
MNKTKLTPEYAWLQEQIDFSLNKMKDNQAIFKTLVPPAASKNLVYIPEESTDWTASFWIGMLLLGKELSGTSDYDEVIASQMAEFHHRLAHEIGLETHDIGFLYSLSAVADYRVNKNETSKELAVKAADLLMKRYLPSAGIIQAWGNLNDPEQQGRMIIDCLMNLPLLYFAAEVTGDDSYAKAAYRHAKQTQKYIVRENATTYHTYYFDPVTGDPIEGKTQQGFSDDSCWSRGQAWGIYGFTLSYLHSGDTSFLETAKAVADYFIKELPADKISYWDLIFNDGSGEERDSSAASIAVCGLLELARHLPLSDAKRAEYETVALEIMTSLAKDYTTKEQPESNGLLLHGVYDKKSDKGVDECMIWGDYYYVEALIRLRQSWFAYWY